MLRRTALVPIICILFAVSASGQTPEVERTPVSDSDLDTAKWQTIDLPALTFRLPREFQPTGNSCYHYRCDFFKSNGTLVTISYTGLLYSTPATRAKPDFGESSLKVDGLIAQVFQYSSDGEIRYQVTFPSDEIGQPVANLEFRSKDPTVTKLAAMAVQTIRFKSKLKGPQRIYLAKECQVRAIPTPATLTFADLVKRTGTNVNDDEFALEIRSRRISYDVTQERLNELKKRGIGRLALTALAEVEREMEEQTRVYELFTANFNAREPEKLMTALNAGREFLDRWGCDPLWKDQVNFIRPWLPRIEHQIGYPW